MSFDALAQGNPSEYPREPHTGPTGWPNKTVHFLRYHIFAATTEYRYNHAVFAEVLRNYSRKQQFHGRMAVVTEEFS